jgi:hypothetical protein
VKSERVVIGFKRSVSSGVSLSINAREVPIRARLPDFILGAAEFLTVLVQKRWAVLLPSEKGDG